MRRTLTYTDEAIRDLIAIRHWLTQPGAGPTAKKRLQSITRAADSLVQHPCRYSKGEVAGTRELPCEGHRIVYSVNPDTSDNASAGDVLILRIFGPGQSRGQS